MKFYYNGQLIRTSKNHIYTHAVIDESGRCRGCRANRETAEAIISTEITHKEQSIQNCKNAIKAMESGKSGYIYKDGRKTWFTKFRSDATIEEFKRYIEMDLNRMAEIKATWKVVELEAR